ncbi:hypothetical protein [Chryseosolibacter indicus]|uniref:DUF4843 domain-containing protein n=1 Tax=Chryseosolibacter indicus TaxID=2782351 RepID=A0ABS5VUW6_9BACT|nr:hypothetical protein [Chryseosolibacter indicus]MBT1705222.1 hypothetical protein [Chryseosolibacter indicus]
MKKLSFIFLGVIALVLHSCVDDNEIATSNEKIQFTFNVTSSVNSAGRSAARLPEGAYVSITLNNSNGTAVLTNHRLDIMTLGDGLVTTPLELLQGRYTLTDFMIVSGSEIIYATPKKGSPLSQVVEHALPYNFSVSKNTVANVPMQVISTSSTQPQAFGYTSFHLEVVNALQISVFEATDGTVVLTNASASIMKGDTVVGDFTLGGKVNTIAFAGDPSQIYTLVVRKEGHADYRKSFSYNDLIAALGDKPLKVFFEQNAFEILLQAGGSERYEFALAGSGQVNINWNDTATTTYTLPMSIELNLSEQWYNLRITGDIGQITGIDAFGYDTEIEQIGGLQYLTSLRSFTPGWFAPDTIDFTHNLQLQSINIPFTNFPGGVFLPEENYIRSVTLEKISNLVDFVDNIYRNATTHNTREGFILIFDVYEPMPAPTKAKLQTLIDEYQWNIQVADEFFEDSND